jgi:hypothetical protein
MAEAQIPTPLVRRHLLEKALDPSEALGIAEAYLAEERTMEALAFLAAFVLRSIAALEGSEPSPEEWTRLEAAARAAGKMVYADTARRQAHRHED